jgi:hypothetical protein
MSPLAHQHDRATHFVHSYPQLPHRQSTAGAARPRSRTAPRCATFRPRVDVNAARTGATEPAVARRCGNKTRHRPETEAHYKRRETLGTGLGSAMVELIGAAFLLLCMAPLLARDPDVRRHR